jgi:hypothetical protein
MKNEEVDIQSMAGSSPTIEGFEGLYSIQEETVEMESNSLIDCLVVEKEVVVMDIVPFLEPKSHVMDIVPFEHQEHDWKNCVLISTFIPRNMSTFSIYQC